MQNLPPLTTMYNAFTRRDPSFEGVFYVGVKTTGIFCRVTCPARKPNPENIEYFSSPNEALYAGYRPCARCNPLDHENNKTETITRLMDAIEQSAEHRISDKDLRRMNIDPSTARRQFKKYYGMTFQAYQRARRMGSALHEIRAGQPVIEAQIDGGFSSASGFWQSFKQVFGTPPSQAKQVKCLLARWIETPLGAMLAIADDAGLYLLEFVERRALEKEILSLRKRSGAYIVPGDNPILETTDRELQDYFNGKSASFDLPLTLIGSDFEKSVWSLLQSIPPGETRSYSWMAAQLGKPQAPRAIGQANGRNQLALVVPCHRVIRADGSLCGYGGGLWRKRWLLEHEKHFQ
jgi:AraC family transcriptional regulator, regulatory protein of adaptative response / methylated-DNA-[protein]-cysteine methyltransferase